MTFDQVVSLASPILDYRTRRSDQSTYHSAVHPPKQAKERELFFKGSPHPTPWAPVTVLRSASPAATTTRSTKTSPPSPHRT